ncbi:MAG: hypothetical protein CM1200mP26_25600 [Acidimicrobiales bacterium]|nr:MAG: hypothetical protein CM1200mP26_25600 [Acidimicrobiales bacterium]
MIFPSTQSVSLYTSANVGPGDAIAHKGGVNHPVVPEEGQGGVQHRHLDMLAPGTTFTGSRAAVTAWAVVKAVDLSDTMFAPGRETGCQD